LQLWYSKNENFKSVVIHSDTSRLDKKTRVLNEEKFINSKVDIACVVDTFNEGIDIPNVDCLLLCRPTQSSTIAIQQFGRGLRKAEGKEIVKVIDFIGNHKTFLSTLKENKINVMADLEFPDHYEYKNKDLDKIITSSKKFNSKIITTEKDYLRIDNQIKKEIQFVKSELIIIDEEKFIKEII